MYGAINIHRVGTRSTITGRERTARIRQIYMRLTKVTLNIILIWTDISILFNGVILGFIGS